MKKILIVIMMLALLMVGCSKEEDPLIGSWLDESSGIMVTFEEDGVCSFSGIYGEYTADETQITMVVDGDEDIYNYAILNDVLELSVPGVDDFEVYFNKIKKNN